MRCSTRRFNSPPSSLSQRVFDVRLGCRAVQNRACVRGPPPGAQYGATQELLGRRAPQVMDSRCAHKGAANTSAKTRSVICFAFQAVEQDATAVDQDLHGPAKAKLRKVPGFTCVAFPSRDAFKLPKIRQTQRS